MPEIGPREVPARVTPTGLIDGPIVFGELGVLDV
jgi:hypothetical protein